ncbi:RDD family protein [Corynebacterium kozikiae]|uniref:RDD family protein n=1 Tax=Corynebacterium kozikiae TaxID=2968469 RepID=UPI00211C73FA|nr:RDD family protein [Corynebacterium sp. 76QC2CO]MCQ9342237.1 RDD family protein [Corynebacterium sp. 76QC2CO]MCQ9369850.1 RDD family protein [Corynebacterium sp. 35RC1]
MSKPKRSWLDGPQIPAQFDQGQPSRWPGEALGLPKEGPGSLASVMRRACGVAIDWAICLGFAYLIHAFTGALGGVSTIVYMLFIILGIVSVTLFARTPGQALLGMGVARIDVPSARVGFWRACARTVGTALIFPAVLVDADGRGIHDRATGTSTVRG